jgi:hypothetical protein
MAKPLEQTKVGGNIMRRSWAEAKWEREREVRWTIREMRK